MTSFSSSPSAREASRQKTKPNSNLALHLTDTHLTPLLSSTSPATPNSNPQIEPLSNLTSTALAAYNSSLHMKLGNPQRIIVETHSSGPILLHSFIASIPSTQSNSARHHSPSTNTHTHAHNTRMNGLENINGVSSIRDLEILSAAREEMRPMSGTTEGSQPGEEHHDARDEGAQGPLLVGTVVARAAEYIGEARRAANRVEVVAHGIQRELMKDKEVKRDGEDEGE